MLTKIFRIPAKLVKYTIIGITLLLGVILSLPYLFPGYVSDQIKKWANGHIQTELSFTSARLSFFEHFPSLTLTLQDFSLNGSAPFEKDTLVVAEKVSLGVNLFSMFGSSVKINEIYLSNGRINIQVNEEGTPNYNVYTASTTDTEGNEADSSNTSLKLQKIQIDECALVYQDASIPFHLSSSEVNYQGKGDLDKMVFDLKSRLEMKDVSLSYAHENYFVNKQLRARLITKVNTGSLQLLFEETAMRINELPLRFKGRFDFLSNGYDMDFNVFTRKATFENFFTAMPPSAVQWMNNTTIKGDVQLNAQLKGKYAASENTAPNLTFSMKVLNGSIAAAQSSTPIEKIHLQLDGRLPGLSVEQVQVKIDSVYAALGKQFVAGNFELKGLSKPFIKGNIKASADLAEWNKTLALESLAELRGMLNMNAQFNGRLDIAAGIWPITLANLSYRNGYIKTNYYPNAISDIQVDVMVKNQSGTNKDLSITTTPIAFTFEGKPFTITSDIKNLDNLQYDIQSKGTFDIGRIYKVFAIEGYDIDGSIITDLSMRGSQEAITAKRFKELQHSGTLQLRKINISSSDFPKPLTINDGLFRIKNDQLVAENIACSYGSTRATMKGYVSNVINYMLQDDAPLRGKLTVQANQINLDELTSPLSEGPADTNTNTSTVATGVVPVPHNLDLQLVAQVGKINYNGLQLDKCSSVVTVKKGALNINTAAFEVVGAPVAFSGSYQPTDLNNARFTANITADEFDVSRAYKEITLFSEMAPSAAKAKGIVSLKYELSGRLNNEMEPVLPSLKGGGTLTLKQVKLYGFKLLSEIKKRTGKGLDDSPDLSNIVLKTTVANNIMTLERTKLRIAGFRPRFQGQASLDGKLNLQCRLGLPPFGIIGIPLTVTGTQDNPIVKFRRGRKADELEETEDDADEEDKAEAEAASVVEAGNQQ